MSVTKNCGALLRESELRRLDGVKRASDDNLPQILVTLILYYHKTSAI